MSVPAQPKHSALCVFNKLDTFCNGSGSVKTFSCHYTANLHEISVTGWSLKLNSDRRSQNKKHLALRNKCTLKTTKPISCDAFMSYFTKGVVQTQPHCAMWGGLSRRWLHVLASPVSIVVERLIQKHDVMVSSWNVTAGHRIRLTCVPTCTSNYGSDQGHIWYKDGVRLLEGGAGSSRVLPLDPVSHKDEGSYVCTSFGYDPSSPVNLTVLAEVRSLHSDEDPPPPQPVPEEDSSFGWSPVSLFCIVLVFGICCGLVVVTAVGIAAWQKRRETEGWQRKNQREEESWADSATSGSSYHIYTSLNESSQSVAQYERVGNVQCCPDDSCNYEN